MPLQCDPQWGNDEMGTIGNGERSTICGEGCAMSCVSMALNGLGITVGGERRVVFSQLEWRPIQRVSACVSKAS